MSTSSNESLCRDLEIIILSEGSQKEKDKQHTIITLMQNLDYDANDPIYAMDTYRRREQACGCRGKGRRGEEGWIQLTSNLRNSFTADVAHGQSYIDLSFVNYSGQTFLELYQKPRNSP